MIPLTALRQDVLIGSGITTFIFLVAILAHHTYTPLPSNTTATVLQAVPVPTESTTPLDPAPNSPNDTKTSVQATDTPSSLVTDNHAPTSHLSTKPKRKDVSATHTTDTTYQSHVATLIQEQTNALRKRHTLPILTIDTALTKNAIAYSRALLSRGFISHTDASGCDMTCRFTKDQYNAVAWGENLAVLYFDERPDAAYVADYFMRAWSESPDHLANILSATYTHEGIGVAINDNSIYVTVQFAKPE
jgi:uncharacterized protein YkwD